MKKKTIFLCIIALCLLTATAITAYKWPRHKAFAYNNTSLWYAYQGTMLVSEFKKDLAKVTVSYTEKRNIWAPSAYTGSISVNNLPYTIINRDIDGFIESWQEKNRIARSPYIRFTAVIDRDKALEAGIAIPTTAAVIDLYISKDFNKFYLCEHPPTNADQLNIYAYPAADPTEAQAIYNALGLNSQTGRQ